MNDTSRIAPVSVDDIEPALLHQAISERAYHIYCASGCKDGHCMDNWLQAERELRVRAEAPSGALQLASIIGPRALAASPAPARPHSVSP